MRVPGEVLFTISIFNVKPNDIVRDIVLVEFPIHILDILIGNIIPSTLVICYRKLLGKGCIAGEIAVRTDDIFR